MKNNEQQLKSQGSQDYRKVLLASLISQVGSHLLTLALAAYVFSRSGVAVYAALVFVFSTVPATVLSARLGAWLDRSLNRRLLMRNDAFSAVISLLCGVCIAASLPLGVAVVLLSIRSICLFVARTGSLRWIKETSPQEFLAARMKLYYLTFFISTAIAGIGGSLLLQTGSLTWVIVADVVTYLMSILCFSQLSAIELSSVPGFQSRRSQRLSATLFEILANPVVRKPFLMVCLTQAIFQGAYSSLVTFLPMSRFGLNASGSGLFQLAASLGITLGFVVLWKRPQFLEASNGLLNRSGLFGLMALGALLVATVADHLVVSALAFTSLNFFYECLWLDSSAQFFRDSPRENAGRYQFTLSAVASFGMAFVTFMYSAALDGYGLLTASVALIGFGGTGLLLCWIAFRGFQLKSRVIS